MKDYSRFDFLTYTIENHINCYFFCQRFEDSFDIAQSINSNCTLFIIYFFMKSLAINKLAINTHDHLTGFY